MSRQAPPDAPRATTRIECDQTAGYNVKAGAHYYEFCPFCGHRTDEGETHEIRIDIRN
ncbi:hypothetical protein [Haloferax profundi]|uniref:hypothetical protein n=1 Tax=Haloferax profundi TaxID=1544718 RepID=UPI000AF13245|nr:hypothetical protein [Haloferax profundi]